MLKMLPLIIAVLFGISAVTLASCHEAEAGTRYNKKVQELQAQYGAKMKDFAYHDGESIDQLMDRLIVHFKRMGAKKKKAMEAKKVVQKIEAKIVEAEKPKPVLVKNKSYKEEFPVLQLLNFKKGW